MGPDMDIKFHQVVMKIARYDINVSQFTLMGVPTIDKDHLVMKISKHFLS